MGAEIGLNESMSPEEISSYAESIAQEVAASGKGYNE
jgi:hypothetical protein